MIQLQGISKKFGDSYALENISLHVAAGSIAGLLGPNGAGKSTTLRILTTILQPSSGSGSVGGFDLEKEPDKIRKIVGCLPEVSPLTDVLPVGEYLRFVAKIRGIAQQNLNTALERVIDLCDLRSVILRPCGVLSKGFKRRVGLAQAIIHEPKVLLLDEPTDGLDSQQILQFRKLLLALKGSTTILLSTHLLGEVEHVCDQIIFVSRGKISGSGALDEFTKSRSLESSYLELMRGQAHELPGGGVSP